MALVLLSLIVLGISQIEIFSNFHLITTDRRAGVSNTASLALEYMNKKIARAIGNETMNDSVVTTNAISGNPAIEVYIDSDASGGVGDGQRDTVNDHWIAYRFTGATGVPATQYQIWYCPQCSDFTCATCTPAWGYTDNIIAKNIKGFAPSKPSNPLTSNYVTVQIQACWDATQTYYSCGTQDNPSATMKADIRMPSVSTN